MEKLLPLLGFSCFLLPALASAAELGWESVPLAFQFASGEAARKYLPAAMGGGFAVFDFDGDGRLDLFFPNGGDLPSGAKTKPSQSNRLFRNLGGLHFEDVTSASGLAGSRYSTGAAAGDFDSDGRPDLAVAVLNGIELYRNRGGGRFDNVTAASGIDNRGRWAIGAAWLDYDGDGDLDLFVLNYLDWQPDREPACKVAGRIDFCHPRHYGPQPNALFRNEGQGRFSDVSGESGIGRHKGKGMGVAVADFDGNGRPDLFVTNDAMPAFLFLNRPDGTFEEAGFEWGVAVPGDGKPVSGMGADSQDLDGDGKPDLIYTALKDETFPLYRSTGADFEDIGPRSRLATASRAYPGWGVMFADLDRDGNLDAVAASSDALSGQVDASRKGPVVWFRNNGPGGFEPVELPGGRAMHRGLVAADLDGDGCDELVVTALDGPARILHRTCSEEPGKARKRQWQGSSAVGYASSVWPVSR